MSVKVAILDLNAGHPNQGLRCIQDILVRYSQKNQIALDFEIFEVRVKNEIPDSDFDIYISSGGPGSPLESVGTEWENNYFGLINELEAINNNPDRLDKKYVFFICHSFQLICRHYQLGTLSKRKSTSFGIFPIPRTLAGKTEELFRGLDEPFYAVDSRDWQVVEPDEKQFITMGAKILALEKERPHVNLERCIMAIRFNAYFFGTQFHPEADPVGMKKLLLEEEKKNQIIQVHGADKYADMLQFLDDPKKLERTQNQIIPAFINQAIQALQETYS
ncbi:type 1 glutamine amidotransferase [Adhaeribacter swui]|uniref:type 1 glutamine amidotransferase n=1 Tax=Adhaeribacter swui TaxID=2086471 RepID=UPI00293BF8B9|nr:GMP synthase [Adhaeribacter swui]